MGLASSKDHGRWEGSHGAAGLLGDEGGLGWDRETDWDGLVEKEGRGLGR